MGTTGTGHKPGNPAWVKGVSGNPYGRPRGQTTAQAALHDPDTFFAVKHARWYRLCLELGNTLNWTKAARRAGYSPRSARFIAWPLRRHPAVQILVRRIWAIIDHPVISREYRQRLAEGKHGLWW